MTTPILGTAEVNNSQHDKAVDASPRPSFPLTPSFKVIKIYLKSSFTEQPNSPEIFNLANSPENSYEIDIMQDSISNDTHEVSITVTVTAKIYNKVSYIVNVKQSGVFQFENVSPELTDELLNINCPALLMPHIKSNISDLVLRSGFNSFSISDFDFKAIYAQKKFFLDLQKNRAKLK
jgi:preprotein translocase subunit SecB